MKVRRILCLFFALFIISCAAKKEDTTEAAAPSPTGIQSMSSKMYYTTDRYKNARVAYNGVSSFFFSVGVRNGSKYENPIGFDYTFDCDMTTLKCTDDRNNKATISSDGSQFSINRDIFFKE